MSTLHRFDGKGEIYAKGRPMYAPALFHELSCLYPAGTIAADIGAGTGIFTAQLLNAGFRVYAVEPSDDMRRKAEETLAHHPGFSSLSGCDQATGLPDASVELVTAAQAFHWFEPDAFRAECRRILRPGGRILLVYNFREESAPCTQALIELRRRYTPEFPGFSGGLDDGALRAFFGGACRVMRYDNSLTYDRMGYIARVLSSSYSLPESDRRYTAYLADIGALFDRFAVDGRITVPTYTAAYWGE